MTTWRSCNFVGSVTSLHVDNLFLLKRKWSEEYDPTFEMDFSTLKGTEQMRKKEKNFYFLKNLACEGEIERM